jgi:hypothetical protein
VSLQLNTQTKEIAVAIASRGMSIQEAYRIYREGSLVVNRQYQRKLVWTQDEKARLIDSVLKQYPIPLILLASSGEGTHKLEIIDGMQRLNAVFGFIENEYLYNGQAFDTEQFARAKQAAEDGLFTTYESTTPRLDKTACANFLDYQLAITQFDADNQAHVVSVFGRINSGGRQLSDQERRQAGVINPFANLVRSLASELRGDASKESLLLSEMPAISIETQRASQKYGLVAQDIFWCKQGIIRSKDLISSEDEEIVADLAASILLAAPLAISRETLDALYDPKSDLCTSVGNALTVYTPDRLREEITRTFSIVKELIASHDSADNFLRKLVRPGNNPIKTPFYSIFMAFHQLVVKEQLTPSDLPNLFKALHLSGNRLVYSAHYAKAEDRVNNINVIRGLIAPYFIKQEPPIITHGPSLALDLENSLRRSKTESANYELKQGILDLGNSRSIDKNLLARINETICAIANLGPQSRGFLTIGVADKKSDAERVAALDSVTPIDIAGRYVVGIEREAKLLGKKLDDYVAIITQSIRSSGVPEPLKTQVLTSIDVITYSGHSVVRITVPSQASPSFIDNRCFVRHVANTIELTKLAEIAAITQKFS